MKIAHEHIGLLIGAIGLTGNVLKIWDSTTGFSFVIYGALIFVFADKIRKMENGE